MGNNVITVIFADGSRRIVNAPDNFDWSSYPREINMDGFDVVQYIGTQDGVPHYKVTEDRNDG